MAARLTADLQACIDSATSWIKFSYTLPETLANEYGKTCFGLEEAKGNLGLVSWAAALSEPQVAAALKQAMQAIAQAGVSLVLQWFFMLRGPDGRTEVERATTNIKEAVAGARTIVMGL